METILQSRSQKVTATILAVVIVASVGYAVYFFTRPTTVTTTQVPVTQTKPVVTDADRIALMSKPASVSADTSLTDKQRLKMISKVAKKNVATSTISDTVRLEMMSKPAGNL